MTQKEALVNIFEALDGPFARSLRFGFITEWLEDINWHKEHGMICDTLNPLITKTWYEIKGKEEELKNSIEPRVSIAGVAVERSQLLYELRKVDYYHAFNLIFGWGLDTSWKSTMGQEFIDELLSLALLGNNK